MNTNQLKKFAQTARIKLIEQVGAKLDYVLTHDTAELRGKTSSINKLKDALSKNGKEILIEKVAYTWFNRLIALRFMDANGYQPIGISVISPSSLTNSVSPELLDYAHAGNIPSELKVNTQHIMDLLDGRTSSSNPDNEVFRILLVAVCNHLNGIFPFLFERIDDYTELLLPDDLTSPFSIVNDIVNGMSNEDCSQVEIIGWLYQFYISEKKDQVFASKSAVKKEDIPAATQLFTPRWIVEYMVQNTVGKLLLQNKPGSKLKEHMPYFIESPSSNTEDYLKVGSVEEIRLLDQACGSGHVLVYGFDLFYKIYEEEGYNPNDIPMLIIQNNLHGFEIDERASQLAGFAIMMKARSYHRRFFRNPIEPNILCFEDLRLDSEEIKETFEQIGCQLSEELKHDLLTMQQATNYGSLISPQTPISELLTVLEILKIHEDTKDIFLRGRLEQISKTISQLIPLCTKYHCVVDNPPYMGGGKMNDQLAIFVKNYYPDAKADLLTCFVQRGIEVTPKHGYSGWVTMENWMFLSSFENFRKRLIDNTTILSLSHFGWHIMRIAFGTVSFILENTPPRADFNGVYSYMEIDDINKEIERPIRFPVQNDRFKSVNQLIFKKIPGSPIGYWASDDLISTFQKGEPLKKHGDTRQGMATSNNERFLRYWFEVGRNNIAVGLKNRNEAKEIRHKWIPYNKGGRFMKWYGNQEYVVNWSNDGKELIDFATIKYGSATRTIKSISEYFKPSLSWSKVTGGSFSVRFYPAGYIFDVAGCCIFFSDESKMFSVLGFLNSIPVAKMLEVLSPTLNYEAGIVAKLPLLNTNNIIRDKTISCIDIATVCWNSSEMSFDYVHNHLIKQNTHLLEESFDLYEQYYRNKFSILQMNEVELNRQFINIYGLEDELTPEVPLDEITILKEETSIVNGELVFHADEVFAQFVSYAVGCMFGRYSLDKEGLILANQGETLKDYLNKISKAKEELSFIPDEDNAIPILNDEWFEDDIVARFHTFLKVSFGEQQFQKNLAFVEECLGKNIRQYFSKDFYKEHIKRYKKRPIYWMFSSPKGYFNVLIYMHRYTPDTLSTILNGYLREFIGKLELQRNHQDHIRVSGSPSEQNKAQKEIDKINDMIADCRNYESEILLPLAGLRINIDLDDGVLVNYNKFGNAIALVDGLNDKKTKKKVMEFDWIDREQIR
jgi:hypothetical protein